MLEEDPLMAPGSGAYDRDNSDGSQLFAQKSIIYQHHRQSVEIMAHSQQFFSLMPHYLLAKYNLLRLDQPIASNSHLKILH